MSLILEALRKSEAERRRGQAPDLRVELPPAPATRAAPASVWRRVAVMLALLLPAGWLARAWWPAPPPAAPPHTSTATPAPTRDAPPTAPAPLAAVPAAATAATAPATTPARPAAASSASAAGVAPSTSPPTSTSTSTSAVAATSAATTGVAPSTPPSTSAAAATTAAPAAPAPAAPPSATPPASLPAPPLPAQPASAAAIDTSLPLSTLSVEERRALPPLKLSMHLWNPDPARRFVILDGQRAGEGDRIGAAVVAAITREGVVLDWNGRRLRLPLP